MTTVIPDMDPTRPARVDPRKIIEPIREHGVTIMFGSPALLDTVGRWGAEHGVKLESVRCVISAGAPMPPRVIERFQGLLRDDAAIHTPYGATESLPGRHASRYRSRRRHLRRPSRSFDRGGGHLHRRRSHRTMGRKPEGCYGRGRGDRGQGAAGEGPQVTREYYNAAGQTALAKIADGEAVRHRMGDLGYFDELGRLWFCGRKSQRVRTAEGTLFTVPCESVFNTHPEVFRTALVGVGEGEAKVPVLCVELEGSVARAQHDRIRTELLDLGAGFEHTKGIRNVLFHPAFPVDIRHNAKIGRGALAAWAAPKVKT